MHSTFAPPRPRGTHAQLLASRRGSLRGMPCVSALRLGAARLYESRAPALGATAATARSAERCEAGGGAAAAADAPAAQSRRAGERWHTARRRRRRPPRWLSLLGRRRFASRRRQLLRRESEATYSPPLSRQQQGANALAERWAGRGRRTRRSLFPFLSESLIRADEILAFLLPA